MSPRIWRNREAQLVPGGHSGIGAECLSCGVTYADQYGQFLFSGRALRDHPAVAEGWWQPNPGRPRTILCPECVHAADAVSGPTTERTIRERLHQILSEAEKDLTDQQKLAFREHLITAVSLHMGSTGLLDTFSQMVERATSAARG